MKLLHLFAFFLLACIPPTEYKPARTPRVYETVSVLTLPIQYRYWFEEVEKCSGLEGELSSVYFYSVLGETFTMDNEPEEKRFRGYFALAETGQKMIFISSSNTLTRWIVKHEMLHFLVYMNFDLVKRDFSNKTEAEKLNEWQHPDEYFNKRCRLLDWQQ